MRVLFLPLLFIATTTFAQTSNTIYTDKEYFRCEDKWVTFGKADKDSNYIFGFIYLDETAGFTFQMGEKFKILDDGSCKLIPQKEKTNVKFRLETNTRRVYVLSPKQLEELGLPKTPDWLHFYKDTKDTAQSLVDRGFHYNHVGGSDIAIPYLEAAYKINKHGNNVEFELAYAYGATKQYNKAIKLLEDALKHDSTNFYFYRELGYSYIGIDSLQKAEEVYTKGISICDKDNQKAEMAVNMAQGYFNIRNKKKLKTWAKKTRKYSKKGSQFLKYIEYFEKNIDKEPKE